MKINIKRKSLDRLVRNVINQLVDTKAERQINIMMIEIGEDEILEVDLNLISIDT